MMEAEKGDIVVVKVFEDPTGDPFATPSKASKHVVEVVRAFSAFGSPRYVVYFRSGPLHGNVMTCNQVSFVAHRS